MECKLDRPIEQLDRARERRGDNAQAIHQTTKGDMKELKDKLRPYCRNWNGNEWEDQPGLLNVVSGICRIYALEFAIEELRQVKCNDIYPLRRVEELDEELKQLEG